MSLRKLQSREIIEKKKRRNQVIVGLLLVAIMMLSIAGYGNREKEEAFKYNGFEFSRSSSGWQVMKQPFSLVTRFLPQDVENVSYSGSWAAGDFAGRNIYFVAYNDEAKIAASEIARNLQFARAQYACLEQDINLSACQDLPLKTCFDDVIFINSLHSGNETKDIKPRVYKEDNCVVIEAQYQDLIEATDRFLFAVFNVM